MKFAILAIIIAISIFGFVQSLNIGDGFLMGLSIATWLYAAILTIKTYK